MSPQNRLKFFVKFLKKENVLKEYIHNAKYGTRFRKKCCLRINIQCSNFLDFITNYIKEYPHCLILDGFNWDKDKNNINWADISHKWFKECKKYNIRKND